MGVRTLEFEAEGKKYTAREFTLEDYPTTEQAFKAFGGEAKDRVQGMKTLIHLSIGLEPEEISGLSLRQAMALVDRVLEVNDMRPKADRAQPETVPPESPSIG